MLPLRNIVVFPHMVVPLFVGRDKSVRALEEVMNGDKQSCWSPRRTNTKTIRRPTPSMTIGVIANVLQLLKLPDGTVKVLVEGRARAAVLRYTDRGRFLSKPRSRQSKRRAATPTRPRPCRAPWSSSSKTM